EQLWEKAFDDPPKHRRRVVEPIEFQLQESPRNVGGILLERDAALVAPSEPDELMPHEAEWLDGDPAFGAHQYAIAKCFAEVVVRRRSARVEQAHDELRALPGKHDQRAAHDAYRN